MAGDEEANRLAVESTLHAAQPAVEHKANVFSRFTYWTAGPLLRKGWKNPLSHSDIWQLPPNEQASEVWRDLEPLWKEEREAAKVAAAQWRQDNPDLAAAWDAYEEAEAEKIRQEARDKQDAGNKAGEAGGKPGGSGGPPAAAKAKEKKEKPPKGPPKPSFARVLLKLTTGKMWLMVFLSVLAGLAPFAGPICIERLVVFLTPDDEGVYQLPLANGILLSILAFVVPFIGEMLQLYALRLAYHIGVRWRAAICAAVYRKSLVLSTKARQSTTMGAIVNHMSSDPQRLFETAHFAPELIYSPVQIVVALAFLFRTLGVWPTLMGILVIVLFTPLNVMIGKRFGALGKAKYMLGDQRVKLVNEVLKSIKAVKYFVMEEPLRERISEIREKEVGLLKRIQYNMTALSVSIGLSPSVILIAAVGTYAVIHDGLDVETAFVALSLFGILRLPIAAMPIFGGTAVLALKAVQRVEGFLLLEEMDLDETDDNTPKDPNVMLEIRDAAFKWTEESPAPVLSGINMNVRRGDLVMVVGKVGSGKTSLAEAILGTLPPVTGDLRRRGTLSYVPQAAWIMNRTIKRNIVFAQAWDADRYDETVQACALAPDFDILQAGDQTEIGERGINLSGGQKQRVSLARAVYANTDVILLDDPLSAVDAHVGKHLFDECINGILKDKTRILTTNQLQYVRYADHVICLSKSGAIEEEGTFEELMDANGAFAELYLEHLGAAEEAAAAGADVVVVDGEIVAVSTTDLRAAGVAAGSAAVSAAGGPKGKAADAGAAAGAKLIEDEEKETGSVSFGIVKRYLLGMGGCLQLVFWIVLIVLRQASTDSTSIFMSQWADGRLTGLTVWPIIFIYFGMVLMGALFTVLRDLWFLRGIVHIARSWHEKLLDAILAAPMCFYDQTPVGRLLNRFSKDFEMFDGVLPKNMNWAFFITFFVISLFGQTIVIVPWFAIAVVPMLGAYYWVQRYYRRSSVELQRIESISKSPLFNHFSETLNGVASVRAYGLIDQFVGESDSRTDANSEAFAAVQVASLWLRSRLAFIGTGLTFVVCFAIVIVRNPDMNIGLAALAITLSLSFSKMLGWLVKNISETEQSFNSVERILYYIENTSPEAPHHREDTKPPASWPEKATIDFRGISMRYRPELPLVLKSIDANIRAGEKIGICGRTGSGKSSLVSLLYRLVEPEAGDILISGRSILNMGLHALRSKLAIIPQDPSLFAGTIRSNLDPTGAFTNDEIWSALNRAYLGDHVRTMDGGLEGEVSEGGSNLSAGEKQLLALARALLQRNKIIILDEATAAVDMATDAAIQEAIRTAFVDCTVLTIAHRLNTIADSDRILVLDDGHMVEFDTPANLLKIDDGHFSALVNDLGAGADQIRAIANKEVSVLNLLKSGVNLLEGSQGSLTLSHAAMSPPTYATVRAGSDMSTSSSSSSSQGSEFVHQFTVPDVALNTVTADAKGKGKKRARKGKGKGRPAAPVDGGDDAFESWWSSEAFESSVLESSTS